MKFNHQFKFKEASPSHRIYTSDDINARFDFVSDSIVRVAIYKDNADMLPTFCVNPNNELSPLGRERLSTEGFALSNPRISENNGVDSFELPCGVTVKVDLNNLVIKYYKDNQILFGDREPLAYNLEKEFGEGSFHYASREIGERVYGLGDKGGELNKSGRAFRIETTDCMGYDASSTDPMYKHIPFYICENSVGSYGIFYDTSDTSYVDLGKEVNNYYEPYKYFKTEDDVLVYYVFFGTKLEIIQQFSRLSGKQAFPPKWSFDYCASTMAYTDADNSQEEMDGFLEKVKSLGLSCNGFYLSSGYTSIGTQRYVFNWNYDKFPDPKAFIKNFSNNGIEIIPNIKPAFLCDHPMYKMIEKNGWFVKNQDGTPFVTRFWDGLGSYLDFTNPQAFDFWKNQVTEKLLDYGITTTWNDNNEYDVKDTDALAVGFGNGEVKASRIRPTLTYLMVLSSYTAHMQKNNKLRPFLSTRSGSIGVRRMAQTWSGDNRTEFKDLRYCHYIGLTMSMSGLYFYGHDLGGFSGDMPSRELLLRWLQHGLFEPRFTIHSWNADGSATMPWSYMDIIDSVRDIFSQRKQLKPYLYNCAYNAVENDIPINAPLFLYYNDDEITEDTNAFMLGKDILAVCIFDEGEDKTSVYLPRENDWYLGDKLYKGGQTIDLTIKAEGKACYLVKAGSVLPTDEAEYGFNKPEELVFTVYPVEQGSFTSDFFADDGESFEYLNNNCSKLHFDVECTADEVIVSVNNSGDMELVPNIKLCDGDNRQLVVK